MIQQYVIRTVRHPEADREVELILDRALDGECELCGAATGYLVAGNELYHAHDEDGECAAGCLDGGCAALLGYACEACFGRAALRSLRWVYAGGMRREEDALYALEIS